MTFKELNFFYKLCENSKVSAVAKELQISQSAVSIAIKSLEEKLQEQLFDRIGKKLILNERGRVFYKATYQHYIALKDANSLFQTDKLQGKLKVASSKTISNFIMPTLYYDFLSRYEKVKIDIQTSNSNCIIQEVLNGELDIGIIETNCNEIDIIKEKLQDDELVLVTSDKEYTKEQYIDSVKKKWIFRESGSGTKEIFFNELGQLSKEIKVFMELQEIQEIKQILLSYKDTISPISKTAVMQEIQEGKLFEVQLKNLHFSREFLLIYHKNKTKTFLFETFTEYLKDSFKSFYKSNP